MNDFQTDYLVNKPEHLEACASWAYGRWGVQKQQGSLKRALNKFEECLQQDALPLTLVTSTTDNNLPVAMASLWESDGDDWPDKAPWIAAVYTLYRYRGMGHATHLITTLEEKAQKLGFNRVFLQSGSAAEFYLKLGYTQVETKTTNSTAAGCLTLFQKNF